MSPAKDPREQGKPKKRHCTERQWGDSQPPSFSSEDQDEDGPATQPRGGGAWILPNTRQEARTPGGRRPARHTSSASSDIVLPEDGAHRAPHKPAPEKSSELQPGRRIVRFKTTGVITVRLRRCNTTSENKCTLIPGSPKSFSLTFFYEVAKRGNILIVV